MFREKIIVLLCFSILGVSSANGQYYYQDIYRTLETNRQHEQYKKDNIHHIQIRSLDAQKRPSPSFKCSKTFSPDYRSTTTVTQSFSTGAGHLTSYFDDKGRVVRTLDSTTSSISHTRIYYNDTSGKIDSLVFLSYAAAHSEKDSLLQFNTNYRLRETHVFYYDTSGMPERMSRLKNSRLYSTIYFEKDSSGRIFKEYEKDNSGRPIYYYKYKSGELTDVFHFNQQQKKMIPDFLFDYDEQGRLAKKTVVLSNSHNYLEWHYSYNASGQISKEVCYNDKKELLGSLVFDYSYQP